MSMKGIDISSHNWDYDSINFYAVKNSGVEAVIIKATEGVDYRDPRLEDSYNGAKEAGISHIGFYHFMSEKTSPTQQAIDFHNAISDKSYDIEPCLDIETNNYGRSPEEVTDRCLEFINKFRELTGQNCMIYTGGYFGRDTLDDRIKGYKGWIAHYGVSEPMATGFTNVVGHQYAAEGDYPGYCDGISGNCDVDNFTEGILLGSAYTGSIGSSDISYHPSALDKARDFVGGRCAELQQLLINKGYNCGGYGADGKFGQGTLDSLIQFQRDNGLAADGLAGDKTFNALNGNTSNNGNDWVRRLQQESNNQGFSNQSVDGIPGKLTLDGAPTLRQGASGNITRLLQEKLVSLGYNTNGVDGIFGSGTNEAVVQFQRDNGLAADGIVGRNTWAKLLGL